MQSVAEAMNDRQQWESIRWAYSREWIGSIIRYEAINDATFRSGAALRQNRFWIWDEEEEGEEGGRWSRVSSSGLGHGLAETGTVATTLP